MCVTDVRHFCTGWAKYGQFGNETGAEEMFREPNLLSHLDDILDEDSDERVLRVLCGSRFTAMLTSLGRVFTMGQLEPTSNVRTEEVMASISTTESNSNIDNNSCSNNKKKSDALTDESSLPNLRNVHHSSLKLDGALFVPITRRGLAPVLSHKPSDDACAHSSHMEGEEKVEVLLQPSSHDDSSSDKRCSLRKRKIDECTEITTCSVNGPIAAAMTSSCATSHASQFRDRMNAKQSKSSIIDISVGAWDVSVLMVPECKN